jgi:hypothetical protein
VPLPRRRADVRLETHKFVVVNEEFDEGPARPMLSDSLL